jgi:hypothetical protein
MFQRIAQVLGLAVGRRGSATLLSIGLPLALLALTGTAPQRPASPGAAAAPRTLPAQDRRPFLPVPPSGDPAGDAVEAAGRAAPIDPNWILAVAPGEECGTQQRYLAELAALGRGPADGTCPANGPCDDPLSRDASIPTGDTPVKTYHLSIHVFCDKKGASCTATQPLVDAAVATLNANFAVWRIQFTYQTEFLKDSKYQGLGAGEEWGMKRRYADSPATKLNVYVVDTGGVSWGTFPWSPNALTYMGGIVMHRSHFGGTPQTTLTHEVGHCIGLWHTFHGVDEVTACSDCYEPAGRPAAQGDVTGDWCSDTAPTPKIFLCGDPGTVDPCSAADWGATPYTNYMGYSGGCRTEFTPQQAGRMHCWTDAVLRGWLR